MTDLKAWKEECWKKFDADKKAAVQKCPKCLQLALEFEPATGRIHCRNCGFEVFIRK